MGHTALFSVSLENVVGVDENLHPSLDDQHLFRSVFDGQEDGVVITAQTTEQAPTSLVYCNPAFTAYVADRNEPSVFRRLDPYHIFGPAQDESPLWASVLQSHQGDGVFSEDIVLSKEDGYRKIIHMRSEPVRDASGRVTHRIASFRDITEKTEMEEILRRNERLACIGMLAAGIAHEINNPMGAALLAAETALDAVASPDADPCVMACLRNIATSLDRCSRIVRTLLRYSRDQPSEKQACSINDVAEQVQEFARPYAERKNAVLRLDLDPDTPLVPMNPLEIELVLVNLVRNAVDAGKGDAVIVIRTERTDGGVRVAVSDNGCGMTQYQIDHVFTPLYTTRRQAGGSGLGMSIAHWIIERHEGRMEVQSKEGIGTTVTVDLFASNDSHTSSQCEKQPWLES